MDDMRSDPPEREAPHSGEGPHSGEASHSGETPHSGEAPHSSEVRRPHRTTETWRLLVGLPLMICSLCLLASLYLYPRFQPPAIPVTGVEQPSLPNAGPNAQPQDKKPQSQPPQAEKPQAQPPTARPGTSYRTLATDALDTCSSAFHDFFVLEELVAHRPGVINDSQFRDDSTQAMQAFREDCAKLAALPEAPAAFREIGALLKHAAGEVAPAADSFTQMLDQSDANLLSDSVEHMLKFVDYTHQAESLLSQMEEMKNI